MTILFGRVVKLRVGRPGAVGREFGTDTEGGGHPHHIDFVTQAGNSGTPGECKITIYNLSPKSRELLRDPKNVATLIAGYASDRVQSIFRGNPSPDTFTIRQQGGDWLTEVTLRDGGRGYDTARLEVSLAGQTGPRAVVDRILLATGWGEGSLDLGDFVWQRGFTWSGTARRALDVLVEALGDSRRWFVRDNNLFILKKGAATTESAPVFSSQSGTLISQPEPVEGGGIRFTGILNASLRIGRVVQVDSIYLGGFYTVVGLSQSGSNHSGPFHSKVKAVKRA